MAPGQEMVKIPVFWCWFNGSVHLRDVAGQSHWVGPEPHKYVWVRSNLVRMSFLLRMMGWSCEAEREEFFSLPPTVMSAEELMMGVKLAKQLEALSILSVCNRDSSSVSKL